ncbi:MAG TPA: TetR/AcrR family transcriptional regulator [Pseudonocardia sp.]|jgi:AcrR family transcriptional regulator|uniref:TetR/AcrR family transcriptional regulator n=1 Tax=Pseudonocardia sp. TaxID=60912 RepID=UPI002F40D619
MEDSPALRVYGGIEGDRRRADRRAQVLEAGLDLLGAPDGTRLTVRGVCQRAGIVARYFYESFADRDELARAVYDAVVDEVAASTAAAVDGCAGEPASRVRAGVANIVRLLDEDPRKARVLFEADLSDELMARRRDNSHQLFVRLLGARARDAYGPVGSAELELTSQFVVGGFARALTAWLGGHVTMSREELTEHCTALFLRIARPAR